MPAASARTSPTDDLDPVAYAVWSAVPLRGGATTERLAAASGVAVRSLLGVLTGLEADGLVAREAGRWRKVSPRRSDTSR